MIEKHRDRFELYNPGTLLLPLEQILAGGMSECRNKTLQKMFLLIGGGEKAGSGIDKIRQGWKSQHWRWPGIQPTLRPDRVRLIMPMVSLLPEDSLERLRQRFGRGFDRLAPAEVQAMVTADVEGEVSNARLREVSQEHPADLTRILQGLVGREFLEQVGQKRGTYYRLPGQAAEAGTVAPPEPGVLTDDDRGSLHKEEDSLHKEEDSLHKAPPEEDPALLAIAQLSREKRRLSPEETEQIVQRLCQGRYLTVKQIATLLERNPDAVRNRFLTPMVENRTLDLRFPNEPNRPDQAYTSHITA